MERWRSYAVTLLMHYEGLRLVPYRDTRGFWTIGIGHKLPLLGPHPTYWTRDQALTQLDDDIDDAVIGCRRVVPDWENLDDTRKAVFVSMVFQLGSQGVEGFPDMLKAVKEKKWVAAAANGVDSIWARYQTPKRAFEEMDLLSGAVQIDALMTRWSKESAHA